MKPRCMVFIGASLDGFIARTDGAIDWLDCATPAEGEGDFGFQQFFDSVDALIVGRNTFETALAFPDWPYGEKPVIVLSRSLTEAPAKAPPTVSVSNEAPATLVARLASKGVLSFYVDGGATIQSFLRAGLIDEMVVSTLPILIGQGISLFGPLEADVRLELASTQSFRCGLVQSRYRVVK